MQDPSTWRLKTTVGQIPLKHIKRSGSLAPEDGSAIDEVIIQSANLAAFAAEVFPSTYSQFGTVMYPRRKWLPGFPALVVTGLDWEEFNGDKPVDPFSGDPTAPPNTYGEYLKITIKYGTTPGNDQEPDPDDPRTFLDVSCESSGNFLAQKIPGTATTCWDQPTVKADKSNAIKDPDIPRTVIENTQTWSVSWPQVPFEFFNSTLIGRFRGVQGMVNSSALQLFNDAPANTILYMGYSLKNQHTWRSGKSGQSPVDVSMKFVEKNFVFAGVHVTHQHMYDKKTHSYRKLYVDGKLPYTGGDLESIWKPS